MTIFAQRRFEPFPDLGGFPWLQANFFRALAGSESRCLKVEAAARQRPQGVSELEVTTALAIDINLSWLSP